MASSWRSRRILGLVQTGNNQELDHIISHDETRSEYHVDIENQENRIETGFTYCHKNR